jgi:hypothetical protein
MKKPSSKAAWISAANSVGVIVEKPDTVKEIIKNIGDKLGVSARGANFEKRVVKALAVELEIEAPEAKPEVVADIPPTNGAMVKNEKPLKAKTPKGMVVVKCKVVIADRKGSMLINNGKIEVWIPLKHISVAGKGSITIPDWLAQTKGI